MKITRLQKFLADKGIASRRTIEDWIREGRIKVDGRTAMIGQSVTPKQRISIDGKALRIQTEPKQTRVLMYNKPEGEISTRNDPKKRATIFKKLPKISGDRWIAVGRLDINSRGLLMFTNNGYLANKLMHPKSELEREYLCRVFGKVSDDMIAQLLQGIEIDTETLRFHSVRFYRGEGINTWYSVIVKEGKYREVRRMWDAVGGKVNRLIRIRYGNLILPDTLRQGHWIELKPKEIRRIFPRQGVEQDDTQVQPKILMDVKHRVNPSTKGQKKKDRFNKKIRKR